MRNSGASATKRSDGRPVGTPFKPGQSANLTGRPKDTFLGFALCAIATIKLLAGHQAKVDSLKFHALMDAQPELLLPPPRV